MLIVIYVTYKTNNISFYILVCSCSNFDQNINQLSNEDFYFGTPGSKLFYRTTTKETQEKYHYSECQKKINNGDQLRIEVALVPIG